MQQTPPIPQTDLHAEEAILCPMCGYDLRGLPEARCPECGAQFTWKELRDPAKRIHPYLFEHHPERSVSSFVQTLVGGWRPARFWTALSPLQPPRLGRLMGYAMVCLLLIAVAMLPALVRSSLRIYHDYRNYRAQVSVQMRRPMVFRTWMPKNWPDAVSEFREMKPGYHYTIFAGDFEAWKWNTLRSSGSVEAYLDSQYPLPPRLEFFQDVLRTAFNARRVVYYRDAGQVVPFVILGAALWPWLALLALQIFQITMYRARIRPTHMLRVAIYSGDLAVWLAGVIAIPAVLDSFALLGVIRGGGAAPPSVLGYSTGLSLIQYFSVFAILMISWRLFQAVGRYLRFRHAIATVLSVQVIVGLTIFKLYFLLAGH